MNKLYVIAEQGKLTACHYRDPRKIIESDAFRVLLNDPLYVLGEREPMLLVIDVLDESAVGGNEG